MKYFKKGDLIFILNGYAIYKILDIKKEFIFLKEVYNRYYYRYPESNIYKYNLHLFKYP